MSTPYESADLLMKLYDLRGDETLRQARDWFVTKFHPETAHEVLAVWLGPESARYLMVTSYWDMAASFVNHGAIDEAMFHDASTEHVAVFAKLEPFLAELRSTSGQPDFLGHLERVVTRMPDAATRLESMRRYMRRSATQGSRGVKR
jgi:hypothetical protein